MCSHPNGRRTIPNSSNDTGVAATDDAIDGFVQQVSLTHQLQDTATPAVPGSLPWSINYINSVTVDGERDALGMWFQETEGATFWTQVLRMSATPPCSSSLPGRPDEVRVSDCNGLCEGDEITIASRRWIVVAKEPAATERPDRLPVEERIVVVPGAAASGRVVGKRGQISSTRPRPSASRPVPHKPSATAPSKLLSLRAEEGW